VETKISTLDQFQEALTELGYECGMADINDDGAKDPILTAIIAVDDVKKTVLVTQEQEYFLIDCDCFSLQQILSRGGLTMNATLLGLLALNHQIAPFAVAIADSTLNDIDPDDPVILVHRLPIGDLNLTEIERAFSSLQQAINAVLALV
jgi:hypothetical protein